MWFTAESSFLYASTWGRIPFSSCLRMEHPIENFSLSYPLMKIHSLGKDRKFYLPALRWSVDKAEWKAPHRERGQGKDTGRYFGAGACLKIASSKNIYPLLDYEEEAVLLFLLCFCVGSVKLVLVFNGKGLKCVLLSYFSFLKTWSTEDFLMNELAGPPSYISSKASRIPIFWIKALTEMPPWISFHA